MSIGRVSSAALMASGLAGVVAPGKVAGGLHLAPAGPRGLAETRAGLGGTYAALGCWALLSRSPVAQRAVGVTWLGAAVVRIAALKVDRPRADWTYWAYLAGELGLGSGAVLASRTRPPSG